VVFFLETPFKTAENLFIKIMKKVDLKLSFEFFPAKNSAAEEQAWDSLKKLENFNPEFFSVTFWCWRWRAIKKRFFCQKNR
jgi:hypothetical protein